MRSHLRAALIALAALPVTLTSTGPVAAFTSPHELASAALGDTVPEPTPSALPRPSPAPSAPESLPVTSASASASTNPNLDSLPHTNLTAVVDPIAVQVHDGYRIRVGVRNSGPQSITAPAGQSAATLHVIFRTCCLWLTTLKSIGDCKIGYIFPPHYPTFPPEPASIDCGSGRTLKAGETFWQSLVFSGLGGDFVTVTGYAADLNESDNRRNLEVRLAEPGSSLPTTGDRTISIAGAAIALMIVGTMVIWYGRRRRNL